MSATVMSGSALARTVSVGVKAAAAPGRAAVRPHAPAGAAKALGWKRNGAGKSLQLRRREAPTVRAAAGAANDDDLQMVEPVIEESAASMDGSLDKPEAEAEEEAPAKGEKAHNDAGGGMSGFAVRAIAGVALGAAGAFFVGMGGLWYTTLVALVSYQCIGEYYDMVRGISVMQKGYKRPPLPLRKLSGVCCMAIVYGTHYGVRSGLFETVTFAMLGMLVMFRREKMRIRFSSITTLVFGLFYCAYLPSFWVRVRGIVVETTLHIPGWVNSMWSFLSTGQLAAAAASNVVQPSGLLCALMPILCIIAADTFAYLGGRTFGKTPLIAISPKKTVEGAVFGLGGSVFFATIMNQVFMWPGNLLAAAGLGVMTFLSSILGDLLESSIKREADMKDSGDLIPGHGGLLDRFDSYIFTGALVYFFWFWFFLLTGSPISPLRPGFRI